MRLYTFCNFYLSSIQQGVQSAHLVHELFLKYPHHTRNDASFALHAWAKFHKTMIVLNGGDAQGVRDTYEQLKTLAAHLKLPYAKFHEDERSLDKTVTVAGIVVPAHIYDAQMVERYQGAKLASVLRLHELLKSKSLAR